VEDFDFSVKGRSKTFRGRPTTKNLKKNDCKDQSSSLQKTNKVAPPTASNKRKLSPRKATPPTSTGLRKRCRRSPSSSSSEDEEVITDSDTEDSMMKGQPQSESNTIAQPKRKKSIAKGAIVKIHLKDFM